MKQFGFGLAAGSGAVLFVVLFTYLTLGDGSATNQFWLGLLVGLITGVLLAVFVEWLWDGWWEH